MKLLFDLLPVLLFFVVFKLAGSYPEAAVAFANAHLGFLVASGVVAPAIAPMLLATLVVIGATALQIGWLLLRRRKVDTMLWVSLGLVVVLGGATVWFQNETFIKWKPSVLYWLMGLTLLLSQLIWRKNLLAALLGDQVRLPESVWRRLTLMWVGFFAFMGCANLFVAYRYPTEIWVDFKLFGGFGLMLLFSVAQGLYMSRHMESSHE